MESAPEITRAAPMARPLEVLLALVRADVRDTRDLTAVGMLKWVMELSFHVLRYFLLVGMILGRGQPGYPLFLLCAVLPWRYLFLVTTRGLTLVRSYQDIISTRLLPRRILPLVPVATEAFNLLLGLLLLAPLMAYYRIAPTLALLWLPLLCLLLVFLITGPAYLAAVFGLYFPDYRGAIVAVLPMGFLASTAVIPAKKIPGDRLPALIQANPVSGLFDSFRAVVMQGRSPRAVDLLYPLAIGVVLLIAGVALYGWREFEFAKEV